MEKKAEDINLPSKRIREAPTEDEEFPKKREMEVQTEHEEFKQTQVRNLGFEVNNFKQFLKVAEGKYFVDKSDLIQDIIDDKTEGYMITRPRRWGKTVNLQMLLTFFMPELDNEGAQVPISKKRKRLFERLNIGKKLISQGKYENKTYINSYAGKRPAIFLKLYPMASDLYETVKVCMSKTFSDFLYIYRNLMLHELEQRRKLIPTGTDTDLYSLDIYGLEEEIFLSRKRLNYSPDSDTDVDIFKRIYHKTSHNLDLITSLSFLCRLVKSHFKKTAYILIDEIDALINYFDTLKERDAQKFLKSLIGNLKDNPDVNKTVICGVTSIDFSDLSSGPNYLTKSNLESGPFASYYGFTEEEIDELLTKCLANTEIDIPTLKSNIKAYYNGYFIGGIQLYNPFSIIQFLENYLKGKSNSSFQNYWCKSGSLGTMIKLFHNIDAMDDNVKRLVEEHEVEILLPESETTAFINDPKLSFFCLLFENGYITKHQKLTNTYVFPNDEVKIHFLKQFLSIVYSKQQPIIDLQNSIVGSFLEAIVNFNEYEKLIANHLLPVLAGNLSEADIQVALNCFSVVGAMAQFNPSHRIRSEHKVRDGVRIDALFVPIKNKSTVAVIQEYKIVYEPNDASSQEIIALSQVFVTNYIKGVLDLAKRDDGKHIESLIVRSIVFYRVATENAYDFLIAEFRFKTIEKVEAFNTWFFTEKFPEIKKKPTLVETTTAKNKCVSEWETLSQEIKEKSDGYQRRGIIPQP